MSIDLNTLIGNENIARDQALGAIAQGAVAKDDLARIEKHLEGLSAALALRNGTIAGAASRLAAAKATATAYSGTSEYKDAAAAVVPLLEGETDATLEAVVGEDLTVKPVAGKNKYADYVTLLNDAQSALDAQTTKIAQARLDAEKAWKDVNLQATLVTAAVAPAERRLTEARRSIAESVRRRAASDGAGAWWAIEKADRLLAQIGDTSTQQTFDDAQDALEQACDAYATAVETLIKAEEALPALISARDSAAANLQKAEAQVLAALTTKVATP